MYSILRKYVATRKIEKATSKFISGYNFAAGHLVSGRCKEELVNHVTHAVNTDTHNEFDDGIRRAIYDFALRLKESTRNAS